MVIIFVVGVISFLLVGLLWLASELTHRPIIAGDNTRPNSDQVGMKDTLDEEQAAVIAATLTILHPLS